jgi:hypothetical protein
VSRCAVSFVVFLAMVAGCSGGSDKYKKSRPKTVNASGVVLYRNQPVVDAIIVCFPTTTGDKAVAASAYTDEDGQFSLQAFPPDKGAVPGDYQVTVVKVEQAPNAPTGPDAHDSPPPPEPKSLIPVKYGKAETTDLKLTIPDAGISDVKFELKD